MEPRGRKLLLADDSVTIQRVIELTFAEEDVEVFAVGDGKQAIDRIRADRPDIVLADVGMPERDGYDVAAFVKGDPALAHIPVLLLTGAFEPIDEGRARAVGCDGVLVKPFEPQMVINRVKDLLAGRRPAGQEPAPQDAASSSAAPAEPQKAGSDSLEDYFDRLDAAFATLGGDAAPAAASRPAAAPASTAAAVAASEPATVEDFASWDPDLAGESNRPARHHEAAAPGAAPAPIPVASLPAPVAAPAVQPIPVSSAPAAAAAAAAAAPPRSRRSDRVPAAESGPAAAPASHASLAEAFASLLAAEHGQATAPIPFASPAPAATPAVDVDDIVRRVLDRLQDDDMRRTVVETAERLVRDEIERIKRAGV
jgi:CheY-like chemotaxis protein